MSQSTISSLKSKINMEMNSAESAISALDHLYQSISRAMEDSVGENAMKSIGSIRGSFVSNVEEGFKKTKEAAERLDTGYSRILGFTGQANLFLAQAHSVLNRLGDV